jgi:hypothetical protein
VAFTRGLTTRPQVVERVQVLEQMNELGRSEAELAFGVRGGAFVASHAQLRVLATLAADGTSATAELRLKIKKS